MTLCNNCGAEGAELVRPLKNTQNTDYDMSLCGPCLVEFRNWSKRWFNWDSKGRMTSIK